MITRSRSVSQGYTLGWYGSGLQP
ncbi:MAG: hypothetical protein RLZZ150_1071, partial [Bacteroidota bacterium]